MRGIWRRATLASYATGKPAVGNGARPRRARRGRESELGLEGRAMRSAAERRCLINLSDGGEDAVTVREFDLATKSLRQGRVRAAQGQAARRLGRTRTRCSSRREWKQGRAGRIRLSLSSSSGSSAASRSRPRSKSSRQPKDGGYGVTPYVLRDAQNRTLSLIDAAARHLPYAKTYVLGAKGARRLAIPDEGAARSTWSTAA